jgi:tetratricopeptide (TPR) repeat protein
MALCATRRALEADALYPAAWVLLGQVLKAQQKPEGARGARAQALRANPNYLPADLCLADLCAIEQRWQDMLRFANATIALEPANNFHAYFLRGWGILRTAPAARSRDQCFEGGGDRQGPAGNPEHFLRAQIYELQHEPDTEAAQLREYPNLPQTRKMWRW